MRLIRVAGDRCPICPARSPRPTQIGCWNSRPEWDVREASSSSSAWVQDRRRTENANSGCTPAVKCGDWKAAASADTQPISETALGIARALGQMYDQHRIRVKRANSLRAALGCPPSRLHQAEKAPARSVSAVSQPHSGPPRKTPRSGHFDHRPARRLILRALTNCQDECA
jgi:hypothetical protein